MNEDDFQAHVMKKHKLIFSPKSVLFPKVDMIRGRKISPEIDVLERNLESKTLAGYEFKFLNNKRKDTNYKSVRAGLAQAIEYFQYGIDKSYIVLGVPRVDPSEDKWGTSFTDLITVVKALVLAYGFDSLGIHLWFEDRDLMQTCQEPRRNFPIEKLTSSEFDGYRLDRACLLSDSFHWNLRFIKKYGLGPIGFWSKTFPKHKNSVHRKSPRKV
jgi:hypothetical protein